LIVARTPALFGDESLSTLALIRALQAFDLADTQVQSLCRLTLFDLFLDNLLYDFKTAKFFATHG
jgi:hypothetical protein